MTRTDRDLIAEARRLATHTADEAPHIGRTRDVLTAVTDKLLQADDLFHEWRDIALGHKAARDAARARVTELEHFHNAVEDLKRNGGAVEVCGVRMELCDADGETATTRNVASAGRLAEQLEGELLGARARIAELEARKPVGYITAYHDTEGWLIEFDGVPFPTPEAARADLLDAIEHSLPGQTPRTLTVYDEEIQTPSMMPRFDPGPRRQGGAR